MIEPDGLPPCALEWRGRAARQLSVRRTRAPRGGVSFAIPDLNVESVRIFHVKALVAFAVVVGDRIQSALSELGFDGLGVPRFDVETETFDHRANRRGIRAAGARRKGILRCLSKDGGS